MVSSNFNKSWFYGIHEYGYGNSTFFTFFSEFNRTWSGLPYIEALLFGVLFLFSMLGNVLVFYLMLQSKSIRTVTNTMISNLVLADIFFSFGSPIIAITRITGTWIFGDAVCKAFVYMLLACSMEMIWTMTVISIDRHICINKPFSKRITPRVAISILVITWAVCLVIFIPLVLYFHTRSFPFGSDHVTICTLSWPKTNGFQVAVFFTVILCVIGFIIPVGVMGVNYFKIIRRLMGSRRNVLKSMNTVKPGIPDTHFRVTRKIRDLRDLKMVKTLLLLVFLFMLMALPIFVVFVFILRDVMERNTQLSSMAFIVTLYIVLANACVNPFLYGVINDDIRSGVLKCFTCKKAASVNCTNVDRRNNIRTVS